MNITPCCRTNKLFTVWIDDWVDDSKVGCRACGKKHNYVDLLKVEKGTNPVTYYCDNCNMAEENLAKDVRTQTIREVVASISEIEFGLDTLPDDMNSGMRMAKSEILETLQALIEDNE